MTETQVPTEQVPQQAEMPFAVVQGEALTILPKDLYIPPDALEVFLEAFEGPLDLLLHLLDIFCSLFVTLVFLQTTNQLGAWIVFVFFFDGPRQQHA